MANWEMTATTIYCNAVEDEVTLMVNKDGMSQCTGCKKYLKPTRATARLIKTKSRQLGKQLGCDGPDCLRLIQYRDRFLAE